jgi:endoglycosylceramidase
MNEPWAGGVYQNPLLFTPGEAGSKNLLPSYDKISNKIREVDNDTLIFYEPVTWGMVFPEEENTSKIPILGSGFTHVPGT